MERGEGWFHMPEGDREDNNIRSIYGLLIGITADGTGQAKFCDRCITYIT